MFIYYPSCFNHITETGDLWFPSLTNLLEPSDHKISISKEKFSSSRCRAANTKLMMSSLAKITNNIFYSLIQRSWFESHYDFFRCCEHTLHDFALLNDFNLSLLNTQEIPRESANVLIMDGFSSTLLHLNWD